MCEHTDTKHSFRYMALFRYLSSSFCNIMTLITEKLTRLTSPKLKQLFSSYLTHSVTDPGGDSYIYICQSWKLLEGGLRVYIVCCLRGNAERLKTGTWPDQGGTPRAPGTYNSAPLLSLSLSLSLSIRHSLGSDVMLMKYSTWTTLSSVN